ncbi:MAG: transposase [Elusimicrobia bacterium]|nr:transposase [Elusimicrobiota bacterium]
MPRQSRVNIPGLLYHIMARGIERRPIFSDKIDYDDFLERLEKGLEQCPGQLLGWALMPNHFHLLFRAGTRGISALMQRVMTGYAVAFNHRHGRAGHLFQNRYKSIVCEEETYLLELVRYIHLNPIRAKIVRNMEELKSYPYSGHSGLMGTHKRKWQEINEVLHRFSMKDSPAKKLYERFVEDGIKAGRRPELMGGGLLRSAGGLAGLLGRSRSEREAYDERVLGSGGFVETVLKGVEGDDRRRAEYRRQDLTIETLAERVASEEGINATSLFERGRQDAVSRGKALLIYLGVEYLGMASREMAKLTQMSDPAASKARARGALLWETSGLKEQPKVN